MPWFTRVLLCACLSGPLLAAPRALAQESAAEKAKGEEAFKKALDRLKSSDAAERAAAADEMGRRGYRLRKEISDVLRPLLNNDPDSTVRAAAGRALGRLGVREAVPDLVRALRDTSSDVRVVSAAALWRLPDASAVQPLLDRLHDNEAAVREWSALALGVIGDRRATPEMVRLLGDSQRAVRLAAVRSLGRIGDPEGLKPLMGYIGAGGRDEEEKEEVVNSVASLKGPDKVLALVQLLNQAEKDEAQKIRVISALGQVGDVLVLPRLRRHVGDNETPTVRTAATEAIAAVQERIKGKPAESAAKP
jgi:HEAT repeat protein